MRFIEKSNKVNKLAQKLHIANGDGYFLRNTITLAKIRNCIKYRDEIIEALEEEKELLVAFIEEEVKDRIRNFKVPKEVRLGGWYHELCYKPSIILSTGVELLVKENSFSNDFSHDMDCGEDEDPYYETDNDIITFV